MARETPSARPISAQSPAEDAVLAGYRKSIDNIDAALIHMLAYPALQRRIELAARAQQDACSSAAESEGGSAQLAATSAAGPGVEES